MTQRYRHAEDHRRETEADIAPDVSRSNEPSWFLDPANEQSRSEFLTRYRKSRNLPETPPHPTRQHVAMTPAYRDLLMARLRPPARFIAQLASSEDAQQTLKQDRAAQKGLTVMQTFVAAASMAIVFGGTVGFLSAEFPALKAKTYALLNVAPPPAKPAAKEPRSLTVASTVISKKQVSTATLQVADVSGQTNSLIPLSLRAEPGTLGSDLFLKISGLPESAYLTSGQRDADKLWALNIADLKDVKLIVPHSQIPEIDLAVAAFESSTGELAAPVKTMTVALSDVVVKPASGPPPQQVAEAKTALPTSPQAGKPGAIPMPTGMTVSLAASQHAGSPLVEEGNTRLKSGDVAAARKAFERAWASGQAEGALGIARSFDPVVLASLRIGKATPDTATALAWYERAASAGNTDAAAAIVRLRMKR
ncbi:hypothetical protein [Aestuariivirga sp.]|uniref:hypothetical protein n=1 Tax=Aestuariivirga sp. TaxID=2650926 RepID=UPI003593E1F7